MNEKQTEAKPRTLDPETWVDPTELLEQKEFWEVFYRCLSKLSGRLAQAFVFRELEGLSSDEISKILNISANNSYVMLHRARMGIRDRVEANWFDHKKAREQNAGL